MNLIKELLQSDIFVTLPFNSEGLTIENNDVKLVNQIRLISQNKDLENPIRLKEIKNFKDKMENWIVDNLDYPFNMPNFYQSLLKTFSDPKVDHEIVSFLIASYPENIIKMLKYEKNKNVEYISHPILNQLRGVKEENKFSNINNAKVGNNTKSMDLQKEIDEVVQEKFKKDQKMYVEYINKVVYSLNEKSKTETGKNLNELDYYQLNPYNRLFEDQILKVHNRLKSEHNYIEEDVVKNLLIPSLNQFNPLITSLWICKEEGDKIVVGKETLANGSFWKALKEINSENIKEWLTKIIKMGDYNQEEKFEIVSGSLSLITKDMEKFKDRLNFFEKLGFSITDNKVFAYASKQGNFYKVYTTNENDLKFNPNIKNKHLYEKISVADLLLKENNAEWNNILTQIKQEREKAKQNKHRLI